MFGLLALGGAVIGGLAQNSASKRATRAQTNAANQNMELQRETRDMQMERFAPWERGGLNAFNALTRELSGGFQASPGYQFALDEGQRAIEGSAAASGNVLSGATMKALQDRGIGMANQEYGNYLNRLTGLAGMGQASAANSAAAIGNYGVSAGNALNNIGNAQSAGAIAQGNAWAGGINNALGGYMMGQMAGGPSPSINLPMGSAANQAVFGNGSWF